MTQLTPPRDVKFGVVLGSAGVGDGCHVVKYNALDEHPQEHGCLAILDEGVEGVTKERLRGRQSLSPLLMSNGTLSPQKTLYCSGVCTNQYL